MKKIVKLFEFVSSSGQFTNHRKRFPHRKTQGMNLAFSYKENKVLKISIAPDRRMFNEIKII